MKGLVSQAGGDVAMPEQLPAGAAPAPQEPAAASGEAPTEEEQQWYDAVQQAGADILFDNDEASAAIIKMLDPEQPGVSAGRAAAEVMITIDAGMDGEVPETVILPASEELLEHVLDIGEASGIFQRSPQVDEEAAQSLVARLAEEYGIDEADFQQAQQAAQGMTGVA